MIATLISGVPIVVAILELARKWVSISTLLTLCFSGGQ